MFYIYHQNDDVKTLLIPVAPKSTFFTSENTGEREMQKKQEKWEQKGSKYAQKLYDL